MKTLCLLIGEGSSERYFFPKILEKKSFTSLSPKEGLLSIYNKGDTFWFFVYPPNLGLNTSGKNRLKKTKTYNESSLYVNNHKHLFPSGGNLHLIVLFDTDDTPETTDVEDIENAISSSGIKLSKKSIFPVHCEIESWYFAGLDISFPYFTNKDEELEKLLTSKTSNKHSKENFQKYIDMDKMIGAKDIAQAVAEHFDENKALKYSDSFKEFHSCIQENNLF